MSTRTFAIRPITTGRHSRQALLALAEELGLLDNDAVTVTVIGDELRITLTSIGHKRLEEPSR